MRTTLVLLPGLDGTGALFDAFGAALPPDITPVVVRYPRDATSYAELLPFIEARVPSDESFVVLGESFSGPLAIELAATNPRVAAMILCATFVTSPVRWLSPRLVRPLWFRLMPRFLIATMLLGRFATRELRDALNRAQAMVSAEVLASRVRSVLAVDARESLNKCRVPMLLLAGAYDRLVRVKAPRPDCEIVTLDAPHLVLQVAPQRAAAEVARFIRASFSSSR